MTPQDPLQSLHPLREPTPVGLWPPAPGWWVIAALLLILLTTLAVWYWRRRKRNRYRQQAIEELLALRDSCPSSSERVQQVNTVLKRSALVAYPGKKIAPLGGSAWLEFLDQTLPPVHRVFAGLDSNILYSAQPSPGKVDAFAEAALTWARHHQREAADA